MTDARSQRTNKGTGREAEAATVGVPRGRYQVLRRLETSQEIQAFIGRDPVTRASVVIKTAPVSRFSASALM